MQERTDTKTVEEAKKIESSVSWILPIVLLCSTATAVSRSDGRLARALCGTKLQRKRRERESSEAGLWKGIGRADAAALALCDEAVLSHLGGKMKRTGALSAPASE